MRRFYALVSLSVLLSSNAYAACPAVTADATDMVMRFKTLSGVSAGVAPASTLGTAAGREAGAFYYNTAFQSLMVCNGTTWNRVSYSSGGYSIDVATATASNGVAYAPTSEIFDYNNGFATTKVNHYGMTVAATATAAETFISGAAGVTLFTAGSPRLKVLDNGYVGIGNTTPKSALHVSGSIMANATNDFASGSFSHVWARAFLNSNGYIWSTVAAGNVDDANLYLSRYNTSHPFVYFGYNSVVGSITTNGSSVAYNTTSDARLKENIKDSDTGLDTLMRIGVRDFSFKADEDRKIVQGYIAQELHEVYPDAVTVGGDDVTKKPWSVDYGRLSPLIVKSVQELKTKNDEMVQRNADLRTRLDRIEKILAEK